MRRAVCATFALVLLASALPVAAAEAPLLRADPIRVEVEAGSQYRGFLTITNTNDHKETYALSANGAGLTISLDAPSVELAPRETKRVGFLVQVATTRAVGDVLARFDASGSGLSAQAYHQVRVLPLKEGPFDAGALPATNFGDISAAITDGGVFEAEISVRNQNLTQAKTFPVRGFAPEGWIMTVEPQELTLGLDETVLLRVHAEPTSSARNGTGRVEIGYTWAHTMVQVSLNVTHMNGSRTGESAVALRIAGDRDAVTVGADGFVPVNITLSNAGTLAWSGAVELDAPEFLTIYGDTSFAIAPGASATRQFNLTLRSGASPGDGDVHFRVPGAAWSVAVAPPTPRGVAPKLVVVGDVQPVPFLSKAYVTALVSDGGRDGWSGEVRASTTGPFGLEEASKTVIVPPGGAVEVGFMVTAGAGAPGDRGEVRFEVEGISHARPLQMVGALRVDGGTRAISLAPGASAPLDLTLWNDGEFPLSGAFVNLTLPPGVTVSGDLRFDVAPGASLSRQIIVKADDPAPPGAGGDLHLRIHRDLEWVVRVDVEGAPGVLAIRLDRDTLELRAGETGSVNVTIENGRDTRWSGVLQRQLPQGVDATLVPDMLVLEPGDRRTFLVTVSALTGEGGDVEFAADDARATLHVATTAREPPVDVGGASPDPQAIALMAIGGVAVAAGAAAAAPKRWPLAFAGLYARLAGARLLEHPVRRRIRALVEAEPGISYNEIGRRLELERGVLDHHVSKLATSGLVLSVRDGQLRRCYAPGSAHPDVRGALDARILAIVRERGEARASEVAQALGVSRQAMHYHLRRMVRDGSILATRVTGGLVLRAGASMRPDAVART